VVVGAGVVGLASALAVTRRTRRPVLVLEAESRVAAHQSGHNSGVIHAGLYYKPGTMRATLCGTGREAMYRFCQDHGVTHRRIGKLVAATSQEELPRLDALAERGRANGLTSIRKLNAEQAREVEPHVAAVAALHVGETGIVDYAEVAAVYARLVADADGEVRCNARVHAIRNENGAWLLDTASGVVRARTLVNCAGLQSDRVARMAGQQVDVSIMPFRGEYYKLVPERASLVRGIIYPVPDPALPFLGVHLTRTVYGEVEAGPNAVFALKREGYSRGSISLRDVGEALSFPGFWRMARQHWRTGVMEYRRSLMKSAFVMSLQRLVPDLQSADVEVGHRGVRAMAVDRAGKMLDDFHLVRGPNSIHVLNAPSPAATASLAIGEYIASQLVGVAAD
jgi:L-2-hydroxyglutarate oxidase